MAKATKILTLDDFADELMAERQSRAVIIVAGTYLDSKLWELIETVLHDKSAKPQDTDELLSSNILHTFSSRIKMCFRLGLIDEPLRRTLDKFREIRNTAAHWKSMAESDRSFQDQLTHLESLVIGRRSYDLTVSKFFAGRQDLNELERQQATSLTLCAILGGIHFKIPKRCVAKAKGMVTIRKALKNDLREKK